MAGWESIFNELHGAGWSLGHVGLVNRSTGRASVQADASGHGHRITVKAPDLTHAYRELLRKAGDLHPVRPAP